MFPDVNLQSRELVVFLYVPDSNERQATVPV